MVLSPFTFTISVNNALVRFDVRRRRWLLPPLVRIKTPDPVRRNRLEVALWVFRLNLPFVCLLVTASSSQQYSRLFAQHRIIPDGYFFSPYVYSGVVTFSGSDVF